MAKVAFRFDIDSHLCMRDGVPVLIDMSERLNVPFTFYINAGRAISIKDTLFSLIKHKHEEDTKKLSAMQKLGLKEYAYAAIVNPRMTRYKENIQMIYRSKCELGIHGGMNHSHWYMYAEKWNYKKCRSELLAGISELRKIIPDYEPLGFAAPGFVTSDNVEKALKDVGFKYSSNWHSNGSDEIFSDFGEYSTIGVNLCGEPGGVAYWEYAKANEWTNEQTINYFMHMVKTKPYIVVFDHPYFAALKEKSLLEHIICQVKDEGCDIVTMSDMIMERRKNG